MEIMTWQERLQRLQASGMKYDPVTMARMRADNFNSSTGTLTGYDCRKCRNRGGYLKVQEDGSTCYQECSCMKTRRSLSRLKASGLQNVIREKTFDSFEAREDWQEQMKQGAQAYAQAPEGWFLLCGQSGSGKTHLCTAICRDRLLEGNEVFYMPWRDEIELLKGYSDPEARDRRKQVLEQAEFLYIDDLLKTGRGPDGRVRPSSADINVAFALLNSRYLSGLPTVISTEFSTRELVDLDEALGSRILEMARGRIFCIRKDPGRNYRTRQLTCKQ